MDDTVTDSRQHLKRKPRSTLQRVPIALNQCRLCEERSDESIQNGLAASQARLMVWTAP